jgi:hypothetical protein
VHLNVPNCLWIKQLGQIEPSAPRTTEAL